MSAELDFGEEAMVRGLPALPAGASHDLLVTVQADHPMECRGVRLWVGCRKHGSGSPATIDILPDQLIHEGGLEAGATITHRATVHIPAAGPVSYHGKRVNFDWSARIRVDIPIWRDKYLELPFLVTPRQP